MLSRYKKLEKEFLEKISPYPEETFKGKGIVTACGSKECFYVGAYVMINLLRYFGCYLPVEVWKFDWEKDDKWDKIFNDIDGVIVKYYDRTIAEVERKGWSLKPLIMCHTPYE